MDASETQSQQPADEAQQASDSTDLHASSAAPSEDTGGSSPEPTPEEYPDHAGDGEGVAEETVEDMDLPDEIKANLIGEPADADEEPPVRYDEPVTPGRDASTASRTAPAPPPFPVGPQPGFQRPEGSLPPAIRSAERIRPRDSRQRGADRRAQRASQE